MNALLLVFMIVAVGLLFSSMVLSAMASSDAQKATGADTNSTNYITKAHKYSMWAAIVTGVSSFVIIVVAIFYIYHTRHELAQGVAGGLHGAGAFVGKYGQA